MEKIDILLKYAQQSFQEDTGNPNLSFSHPKESRFKNLFQDLKTKNKKRKTMMVYPKSVMLGTDKRTSIIIKNIPDNVSSLQFQQLLSSFSKKIDFFYVPKNIKTRKKLRVAFINVTDYKELVPIYMGLIYKTKFLYSSPNIKIEICYSKVQGKQSLVKRFLSEFIIPSKVNIVMNNNVNNFIYFNKLLAQQL